MIQHEHGKLLYFSYRIFQPFDRVRSIVSTRLGGVSIGHCASLNLALSVGDDEASVIQNRTLLCEAVNS